MHRLLTLAPLLAAIFVLTSHCRAHAQPAPSATPVQSEAAPRILGTMVEGSIDPPGHVEALLAIYAENGTPFVASGPADRTGMPIGTIPRLKHILQVVGYSAEITPVSQAGGVTLHVQLRAFDRVRHIFVSGNQPNLLGGVRQEEVLGKLSIRPGQKLPPAGAERETFIANEADHVREFLRSQGYWEAKARIELSDDGKLPSGVTLLVRVELGPAYPLGPLKVTGATALSPESVADVFRHGLWYTAWISPQPFRRGVLRQDIAKLVAHYRRIGFPGVRIQDDFDPETSLDRRAKDVRLAIEIRERRHVEVEFEGNHEVSSGALLDHLTLLAHGAYDDVEATASAVALENYYHEHGYMLVKVTWRRERISEQSDRLVFVVEEGPMLKVRGVTFVGNHAISSDTLADRIRTRVFPFLGVLGLGEGGFASLRQIELDVQSLVDYYASVGYPDTKVRAEIAPRPGVWRPLTSTIDRAEEPIWRNSESLFVRFLIVEAPLLWVAGMDFACVAPGEKLPHDPDFFLDSLRTVPGGPYQPALIKRDEARIKRALGDEGYQYAQVEAQTTRHGNEMQVTWRVKLGPQVHVGPIFVRGNFLTTEKTIMTWAELRTGDVLTTYGIERAQRNLALIQLFNNPNPVSFPSAGSTDPVVPMVIEVEERHDHFGIIRLGGGASTDQATPGSSFPLGVYAAAGYEHRNLFGHGWTLISQLAYGPSLTNTSASFLNPRFLSTLFRMDIVGSYVRQATLRLGDVHSGSGSFGFSREMYPGVDANIHYNLRNTSRTELLMRGAEPGPFYDQTTVRIGTFISSLSAGVEWHRLDQVLVPSRGFKVAGGVEVALPALSFDVGHDAFIKLYARGLSVVPILSWLSLRYSIRYDQGFPLGGSALLPKVERFAAGGDTTIRGYQLDYALTQAVTAPAVSGVSYVQYRPLGGNLRILQNIDLQFPIARPLYGAIFLDSGIVDYSLDDVSAAGLPPRYRLLALTRQIARR